MSALLETSERHEVRASDQLASSAERMLWRTFQLALEVDLLERTPESKLLRTLAHRTWGDVFLADGAR